MSEHVLICGVSARAAAESAARAGFRVTTIDAYADLDHHPSVRALAIGRDFALRPSATAMARAAREVPCDAAVYLSSFENHPRAIASLARGRLLWGNAPGAVARVRDPFEVASVLRARGFATARVATTAKAGDWLLKPYRSGGGRGVSARRGRHVPARFYLQERIDGTPGSVVFVAVGGRAVPLGVSRQLIGDAAFGATGFRYCGNILAPVEDPQFANGPRLATGAAALADAVAAAFGLVGVNGIDFIARGDSAVPIEVNPRWSASMELVERGVGVSIFAIHAAACVRGELPAQVPRLSAAFGKAIVYARRPVTAPDTRRWLDDPSVRDVPHPAERFTTGQPICTVFASAPNAAMCYKALVDRAQRIYADIERDYNSLATEPDTCASHLSR